MANQSSLDRMNSLEDFRNLRGGHRGPPVTSRFLAEHQVENYGKTGQCQVLSDKVAQSTASVGDSPVDRPATPVKAGGAITPTSFIPSPNTPSRANKARRASDAGAAVMDNRPEMSTTASHYNLQYGPPASPAEAGRRRRMRRATDGGSVYDTGNVLQTVIERRNLRHLSGKGDEVAPAVWPTPPARDSFRRHTTDGSSTTPATSRASRMAPRSRHSFSTMPDMPEDCELTFEEPSAPFGSHAKSVAFLESSVLLLTSQLAEASAREAALADRLLKLQSAAAAATNSRLPSQEAAVKEIRMENELLQKLNKQLQGELTRKNKVLQSASSALPMLHDEATIFSELGVLHEVLTTDQVHAVLELLSLGIHSKDVHRLLLGVSETNANLTPFLQLAGVMREKFDLAEDARNAVNTVDTQSPDGVPSTSANSGTEAILTRDRMVELLRENDVRQLAAMGLPHRLIAEISFAALSGLDPWSIVNLLDGRLRRNSRLDITMAPTLGGVLSQKDQGQFGLESNLAMVLSTLSRQCSLSPMRVLRDRNLGLERTNRALLKQVEELQGLMDMRQCKWTADPAALSSSDLWRVDSLGSSGMPSPASPAPQPRAFRPPQSSPPPMASA